jgi:membrane protease YdiL (CAAX protease family)
LITNSRYLLLFDGAALLVCAVFDSIWRDTLLVAFMLFLPMLDRHWAFAKAVSYRQRRMLLATLIVSMFFILIAHPNALNFILFTLLLVALPEEWFFRAYFMQRVESVTGNQWWANVMTSVLFALLHVPTQGWYGLSVFIPSMILGWFYQQHRDLVVVVLLHTLSNLVYLLYLHEAVVFFSNL